MKIEDAIRKEIANRPTNSTKNKKPMSELQKVSTAVTWFRYFICKPIHAFCLPHKILSARSLYMIQIINSTITELREQIKIDYINYRTKVLLQREQEKILAKELETKVNKNYFP